MANNLFANVPAAVVAKQTISFAAAGFTASNLHIIYEVGSPLKSYIPDREINAVTGFTADKGYYVVPKVDMDMEAILAPPLPNGNITPPAPTSGIVDDTANTFAYTLAVGYVLADHEMTTDGGSSWAAATNPINVGNVNKAVNQVGVRVMAATGRNASAILYNQTAFNASGGGYDADAEAFFTYVEALPATLSTAEKDAVDALVVARKAAGLWAKDIAIYPRVGSTVAAMGVNLKSPGTYSNAYTGTPAVHADGINWGASTDYATLTGLDRDAIASNHFGFDVWIQSNVQNVYFGMVTGTTVAAFLTDAGNLFAYPSIGANSTGIALPNLNNAGLLNTLQRLDDTTQEYYRGASLIGSDGVALNSFGDATQDFQVHGFNNGGNATAVVESYSGVHLAFSGAEQTSNNTSVSNFVTALGR